MALITHAIDFPNMISQMLGALHRPGMKRNAWLKGLLKPFEVIHTKFLTYSDAKLDEVSYNGQTIVLEQMLIAKFGAGIYITNNASGRPALTIGSGNYWTTSIGSGSSWSSSVGASYAPIGFDFTIYVPMAIVFVASEMIAWVKKYNANSFNIIIL